MEIDGDGSKGNITEEPCGKTSKTQQTQQSQPHKKQVRRRLHTSRPYQERLLNMAEARREIVTALKQHRAAMKQASEQQDYHQELQPEPIQVPPQIYLEQDARTNSRKNHPRIYPLTDSPNCFDGFPSSFPRIHPHHPPPHPNPLSFSCPISRIPNPFSSNPLDFYLPNQPLGLNLNFEDFNNIETSLYSSPSSSSSPCMSFASEEIPLTVTSHEVGAESGGGGALHQVLDEKEMAQIRFVGEQHQMEWNDSMNLMKSAWWFKFLKTIDLETEDKAEDNCYHPFDEVMEFPSWLNTNEPYFSDYSSDDYRQDPALPCMEIGEIEGIDGEWLA